MDLITTLTNAFVIAAVGVLLYWQSRGRFATVEREIAEIKQELKEIRAEGDRRFELIMTQILAIQRDMTHIALAVGARNKPEANPA